MGDNVNISGIRAAFETISLTPVTRAGEGNYLEVLKSIFEKETAKMTPAAGLPAGVFVANAAPGQTLASLNIANVSPESSSV
ncbi:hypothetical protein HZB07_01095 [Candidatus Saganbacteria bacterium]|nr:hypothetical protein [Candidatus Saganbacteria bacterium]